MKRRAFLKGIGLAATSPSSVIPKRHVVCRSYYSQDEWNGSAKITRMFRPEDFGAADLQIQTADHGTFQKKTVILADGRPVQEFVYFRGDESFSRVEDQ